MCTDGIVKWMWNFAGNKLLVNYFTQFEFILIQNHVLAFSPATSQREVLLQNLGLGTTQEEYLSTRMMMTMMKQVALHFNMSQWYFFIFFNFS